MNNNTRMIGFIDEFGDKSIHFEKEGVSTFFIVTAIIIDYEHFNILKNKVDLLRAKYTQAPELKSKAKIFKNINLRIKFLNELSDLDFYIYSVVVDKRKIFEQSPLQFRETFFKYVNNLLDTDLYRYYPNIELVADEHGNDKFMNGFIEYVRKQHHQTELFLKPEFRFSDSKSEPLIQLADFISGSLARCYEPKKLIDYPARIIEILEKKILHIREWPETYINNYKDITAADDAYDQEIANFSLKQIYNFINENEGSSNEVINNQLICLHYLVFKFRTNSASYVLADDIIERIKIRGFSLTKRSFSKEIISKLRENKVLIVSSSNGYKIPCSKGDLIRFFNNYNSQILPMIKTLERSSVIIKSATLGKIDLLKMKEFEIIKKIIEVSNTVL